MMVNLPVANAPVSYGAFELTVGIDPEAPDAPTVLDLVAEAGYVGIDAGPVGFLGRGEELTERLAARNLAICGGYIELPFHEPQRMEPALAELDALLEVFDAALPVNRSLDLPAPKPTLAALGTERKHALPGQAVRDPGIGLGAEEWKRLADSLEATVARCRERGYEPTLHNETGTSVEAPWEIERALELTTVDLCLDTGHLLLGGGDPVESLRAWHGRVNHLHAKSARLDVMRGIVADQGPTEEIWRREAFCPLGEGDLDGDGLLTLVWQLGWSGWIVVEQDTLPGPGRLERAQRDQRTNRQYLRDRGL
jgi:inosose dehydratase